MDFERLLVFFLFCIKTFARSVKSIDLHQENKGKKMSSGSYSSATGGAELVPMKYRENVDKLNYLGTLTLDVITGNESKKNLLWYARPDLGDTLVENGAYPLLMRNSYDSYSVVNCHFKEKKDLKPGNYVGPAGIEVLDPDKCLRVLQCYFEADTFVNLGFGDFVCITQNLDYAETHKTSLIKLKVPQYDISSTDTDSLDFPGLELSYTRSPPNENPRYLANLAYIANKKNDKQKLQFFEYVRPKINDFKDGVKNLLSIKDEDSQPATVYFFTGLPENFRDGYYVGPYTIEMTDNEGLLMLKEGYFNAENELNFGNNNVIFRRQYLNFNGKRYVDIVTIRVHNNEYDVLYIDDDSSYDTSQSEL